MSEKKVIHMTNLLQIPLERRMEALLDPEQCLSVLYNYAGNVRKFAEYFASQPEEQEWIMYTAETLMAGSHLFGHWKAAIKTNKIVRMRRLQDRAIDMLEDFATPAGEAAVPEKFAEVRDFAKLVLSDFVAEQIAKAREKEITTAPVTDVLHGETEEEDRALEEAMNL
jgi:hypothetical protein